MKNLSSQRLWSYLGGFSLIHLTTYILVAVVFLIIQGMLPASQRFALEFYEPYRSIDFITGGTQLIRGVVLALILYPFYNTIVKNKRSWLFLFAALWGLVLLGSVEPRPGSIEGLIYTETTLIEHMLVLALGAVQVLLFSWLFIRWEKWCHREKNSTISGGVRNE